MALAAPALRRVVSGRRPTCVLALARGGRRRPGRSDPQTRAVNRATDRSRSSEWVPGARPSRARRSGWTPCPGCWSRWSPASARWCCSTAPALLRARAPAASAGSAASSSPSPARCSAWSCADDLLLLYVFWELTTVFSYLLIGHYADRKASRRAAMQALILTTAGGLAMLVGLFMLGDERRHLPAVARSSRTRRGGTAVDRRRRAGAGRGDHQVRAGAVPLLAARRDGGADAGQRLPARRGDGEGRRLPGRPVRPGVRRRARPGGRSCSGSAWPPCCSAATGRCASTTSSCCSPSAPSASSAS